VLQQAEDKRCCVAAKTQHISQSINQPSVSSSETSSMTLKQWLQYFDAFRVHRYSWQ